MRTAELAILALAIAACETDNQTVERRRSTMNAAYQAAANMQGSDDQLATTRARAERAAFRERIKAELVELDTVLANAYIDARDKATQAKLESATHIRRQIAQDLAALDDESKPFSEVRTRLDERMAELRSVTPLTR